MASLAGEKNKSSKGKILRKPFEVDVDSFIAAKANGRIRTRRIVCARAPNYRFQST